MALTDDQKRKAAGWLNSKKSMLGNGGACPHCGQSRWAIVDLVVTTPMAGNSIQLGGGSTVPMVQVACETCGLVQFFAARPMGILGQE